MKNEVYVGAVQRFSEIHLWSPISFVITWAKKLSIRATGKTQAQ